MIAVTFSPDVSPAVYATLALCLAHAIENAESGARAMAAIGDEQRTKEYTLTADILIAMQRQFERRSAGKY
ncbi:MAG: hypothetical protein IPK16_02640 [Anaerolineales bacterium]|nr:hypothetical protein [Anaerolineales bacterium]